MLFSQRKISKFYTGDQVWAQRQRFRDQSALMEAFSRDMSRDYMQLIAQANSNRVSFYTIDARGSAGSLGDSSVEGRLGAVYSAGLRGVRDANLWETLDVMSSQTGGLTLTGNEQVTALAKLAPWRSRQPVTVGRVR